MLTLDQFREFVKRLNIDLLPDGEVGIREAGNQPPRQVYFIRYPAIETGRVKEVICYFFHRSEFEIFLNPPFWGGHSIEFDLLPEIEDRIRELLTDAS